MFIKTDHEAEENMASGIGARWVRLNISYYHDPKVRRAKCAYLWPYLLVLMGEHRGYIPDDYLDASLIAQDLSLPDVEVEKALDRAKNAGLIEWAVKDVNVGGRGGPNTRTLEGWTTKNWADYQPDPRGPGRNRPRDGLDGNKPSQLQDNTSTNNSPPPIPPPKNMQQLEAMVLSCVAPGKRRGGLCLDSISMQKLRRLVDDHGIDACVRELSECGMTERPVAMLAARLRGGTRSKASPPSADEWRGGAT